MKTKVVIAEDGVHIVIAQGIEHTLQADIVTIKMPDGREFSIDSIILAYEAGYICR
jgi:hypothetical protein